MSLGLKISKIVMIIWTIAIVTITAYGAANNYILGIYAVLIMITAISFPFIIYPFTIELERTKSLLGLIERHIRYEEARKDFEILPAFIEEKRREYLRGLSDAYEDVVKSMGHVEMPSEVMSKLKKIIDERRKILSLLKEGRT